MNIIFIVFRRPETTRKTLEAIRRAKPRRLFIVADGPRNNHPKEAEQCRKVRQLLENIDWDCDVIRDYADENMGCAKRVSTGITNAFKQVEQAIILEDDLLPNESFFNFCQKGLKQYENDSRVMTISGNNFQQGIKRSSKGTSGYFSKYHHCWGWATWKRAWEQYDFTMTPPPGKTARDVIQNYNCTPEEGTYWKEKFEQTKRGEINTWDYQWIYSIWKAKGLSLLPEKNLVQNIGFDEQATHTFSSEIGGQSMSIPAEEFDSKGVGSIVLPDVVEQNVKADQHTFQTWFCPTATQSTSSMLWNQITLPFRMVRDKIKKELHLNQTDASNALKHPYPELLDVPRYQKTEIKLLGKPFEIADARSFYYSYQEIFQQNIYRFKTEKQAPVILDCGSNYGASLVYFRSQYPGSKITAVEADPEIFSLLQKNIASQGVEDVELVNKAVASQKGTICFHQEGADGGRIVSKKQTPQDVIVETTSLDDLIQEPIDFLKIDIEGAETDVLSHSQKLNQVQQLFVEYHSFENEQQQLDQLLSVLQKAGFRYYLHTQFCSATPLVSRETQLGMDMQLNIFAIRNG